MNYKTILFFLLLQILTFQQDLNAQIKIEITNGNSLAQLGKAHPFTDKDREIALTFYNALSSKDMDSIKFVENYYFELSNTDFTSYEFYSALYWISKCITTDKKQLEKELDDPVSKDLFNFFSENNFEKLREYLKLKYALYNYELKSIDKDINKYYNYYNGLLMLNNPYREGWNSKSEIMSWLPLKKGDKVIDLGCGLGYNSFKLSKIVGNEGLVFATDINDLYVNHVKHIVRKSRIKNIFPLLTAPDNIGVRDSVDAVLISSWYHDLYMHESDDERDGLINSMKQVLKINGYLMIIENLYANEIELNIRFIDKRLVIAQLAYWGFSYVGYKEFGKQRYGIIFKHTNEKVKEQTLYADEKLKDTSFLINVDSEKSLINLSDPKSLNNSEKGTEAAKFAYDFFKTGDTASAIKAIHIYDSIIPFENFGGEYSAIQWLCEVQSSPEKERSLLLKDPLSNNFYNTMTDNNNSLIKCFLLKKYNSFNQETDNLSDLSLKTNCNVNNTFLEVYFLALNPEREKWEKASFIIENMKIQKGQIIVNYGSDPGYFTYRFSQLVGIEGRVYAIVFKDEYINALNKFVKEENIRNVETVKGEVNSFSIKEKADIIFMCSFYHKIYGVFDEYDRRKLIKCIKENLNTYGKLVIVGNYPADDEKTLPFNEPLINKQLIEFQLAFYGFELITDVQITPQRYMLTFKLKEN